MATVGPNRPPASAEAPGPAAQPARNPWIAVALGLLLGQVGYFYTRQAKRFWVSSLLGAIAIGLSLLAAWHHMPTLDLDALADPEGILAFESKVMAAMAWPSFVATVNNVACAVDLYLQVSRAQ